MTTTTLLFVLMGIVAGPGVLAGLAVLVHRQARHAIAFDRRLGVPRRQALAAGVGPAQRAGAGGRGAAASRELGALVRMLSLLAPVGAAEREKLGALVRRAGFGHRDALSVFLSLKFALAAAVAAALGYQASSSGVLGGHGVLVAFAMLAGFVVGGIVPEYALRFLCARRARAMAAALPDALDLMVMCLESGLTFERALATVAEELRPIEANLAGELRTMEAELRVGADRRAVLQAFYRRSEVDGLRDLAMTLIQSERFGTPLSQSMKNIAASERTQRAARIETQAQRLPVLMTLPMLLFVVPGTMCLIAGPAFLTAIDSLGALGGG